MSETKFKLKTFTKDLSINSSVLSEMLDSLSKIEITTVFELLPYINKDNVLTYKNQPVDILKLSTLLDKNYEALRKVFTNLKKEKIVQKVKLSCEQYSHFTNVFIFNPWVCSIGNDFYLEILEYFCESKWKKIIDGKCDSRSSYEYMLWEERVRNRDDNCCVICGKNDELEVHHISPYATDYDNRTNINNGITLCRKHHNSKIKGSFHNTYGTVNNTKEQLQEYINIKREEIDLPKILIDEIINK